MTATTSLPISKRRRTKLLKDPAISAYTSAIVSYFRQWQKLPFPPELWRIKETRELNARCDVAFKAFSMSAVGNSKIVSPILVRESILIEHIAKDNESKRRNSYTKIWTSIVRDITSGAKKFLDSVEMNDECLESAFHNIKLARAYRVPTINRNDDTDLLRMLLQQVPAIQIIKQSNKTEF